VASLTPNISSAVWDELSADHLNLGSIGSIMASMKTVADAFIANNSLDSIISQLNDIHPILIFLFSSLAGHGLHVAIRDPAIYTQILFDCQNLISSLPESLQPLAFNLLTFFQNL